MILWLLLFIYSAMADDYSIEEFCFSSPQAMRMTATKANIVFVPSDTVTQDGSCLTVKTKSHRRELVQSYIRNIYPEVNIKFSSAEIRRDLCSLKVEKIKESQNTDTTVSVGQNIYIDAGQSVGQAKSISQVKTLNDFEMNVNQEIIKGNCRFINPERYEIALEVRQDPRPVYPTIPPNSVVIINTPPPDQQTSRLSTTLQLNKGQRIEIGQLVKDLRDKSSTTNLPVSIKHHESSLQVQEKVFLSID